MTKYLVQLEGYLINPEMVVGIFNQKGSRNVVVDTINATGDSSYVLKNTSCQQAADCLGFSVVPRVPIIRDFNLPSR